jgi:ABC-type transport system involved in multi-copper enzyme maturation permease subunit
MSGEPRQLASEDTPAGAAHAPPVTQQTSLGLLHYRPWRGEFHAPARAVWPVARVALRMLLRRKLFWVLFAFGLFIFLMFFFGQFLLDWVKTQIPAESIRFGKWRIPSNALVDRVQRASSFLRGTNQTFRYFFSYQGTILIVMLTLAGSVLVGNDFAFGSLPFYLSKPVSRWHYVAGKCLAIGVVINLLTTVPALALYVQAGFGDWDFFLDSDYFVNGDPPINSPGGPLLLLGIVGYGLLLTACLSLMLVATASWLKRTMPMIMGWVALFLFLPVVAAILVEVLRYDEHWRLLDIWNDLCLVGNALLDAPPRPRQPEWYEALAVLGAVTVLCMSYLNLRTRAVEVVR